MFDLTNNNQNLLNSKTIEETKKNIEKPSEWIVIVHGSPNKIKERLEKNIWPYIIFEISVIKDNFIPDKKTSGSFKFLSYNQ